jgi:hypothetical protein
METPLANQNQNLLTIRWQPVGGLIWVLRRGDDSRFDGGKGD